MSPGVLFLAGVPKAGTSSLFDWFSAHPAVAPSERKETCFFADPGTHVFRPAFSAAAGTGAFDDAFPPAPGARLRVEGTPSTIYSRTALRRIPALPDARALFVVREPASQLRSLHGYFRDNWSYVPAGMDLAAFVAAVRAGTHDFGGNELAANALRGADYAAWLEPWREAMGAERMRVVTFDRLQADPRGLLAEIAAWCGLDPEGFAGAALGVENARYAPRSRALQRLNVAVRGRLPDGPLYRGARALYRRLNTRAPDRSADAETFAALRAEFAPANRRLAEGWGLDLSGWG